MSEEIKEVKTVVVKTMRESKPEAFRKLQLLRREQRQRKRAAFKALGHKLGSKNKKCKLCNLLTSSTEAAVKCAKAK